LFFVFVYLFFCFNISSTIADFLLFWGTGLFVFEVYMDTPPPKKKRVRHEQPEETQQPDNIFDVFQTSSSSYPYQGCEMEN